MMNKGISKFLKITLSILLLVCPFSIKPYSVKAESVGGSSPIIGVNITTIDREYGQRAYQGTVTLTTDMTRWQCVSGSSSGCNVWRSQNTSDVVQDDITGTITYSNSSYWDVYLYQYDFVFDDEYVGYVQFSSGSIGGTTTNIYYINGSHLILTSTQLISSFTINDYSLIKKTDNIMWMFPIESFNLIYSMIQNNIEMAEFYQYANYTFPFFNLKQNDLIGTFYWYQDVPNRFIYFCKNYTITETQFPQYFSVPNGVTFHDSGVINYVRIGSITYYLAWVETIQSSSASIRGNLTYINSETLHFMPIFFGRMDRSFISIDFALNFGLSNRLLDNIQKIAEGTSSSNESAADNDSANADLVSASDSLFNQEDSFNNSMNSNLENIDTSNVLEAMGSKFASSANWVRVQFNTLTNNTPFGSVLSFSLILGLALLLIGRWRHD